MIGFMLGKQLPGMHFSDKKMDDALSRAAFDLYLKQLDFQKRFLLQQDVDALNGYSKLIDDELLRGNMVLPQQGFELLNVRIQQVEKMVAEILAAGVDVNQKESLETDPVKLTYAADLEGLRDYWRRMLKEQIVSRYLESVADQEKAKEKKDDALLWKEAREQGGQTEPGVFSSPASGDGAGSL